MPQEYIDDIVLRGPVGLAVRDYGGAGQPIILLHGGGCAASDMDALAARLRARYCVLTFDFCGHGQSTRCAGPRTFAEGFAGVDASGQETVVSLHGDPPGILRRVPSRGT